MKDAPLTALLAELIAGDAASRRAVPAKTARLLFFRPRLASPDLSQESCFVTVRSFSNSNVPRPRLAAIFK